MKRLFLILAMAAVTISGMAQKHEIGAVVGGLNGLSYKYWLSDKFALQADLAVGLTAAPTGVYYQGTNVLGGTVTNSQYDFTINPNVLYHWDLPSNFKIYAGGGINFGLMSDIRNTDPDAIFGKFGINADAGVSYHFDNIPLVLACDFRPGYGLGFRDANTPHLSFFDWKLGFAVRYCL